MRAASVTLGAALAIALPTALIASRFFTRMTPVRWYDYVVWAVASPLIGLTVTARRVRGVRSCPVERRGLAAAGLALVAVGCPVCNKAVVAILGVSGALTYFAPLQPVLGISSITLLLATLHQVLGTSDPPLEPVGAGAADSEPPALESLAPPSLH